MDKIDERRRCFRLTLSFPASFCVTNTDDQTYQATTLDISALGICLTSRHSINVGDHVSVVVEVSEDEQIVINAEVIWIKERVVYEVANIKVGIKIDDQMKAEEAKFIKFYATQLIEHFKEKSK